MRIRYIGEITHTTQGTLWYHRMRMNISRHFENEKPVSKGQMSGRAHYKISNTIKRIK